MRIVHTLRTFLLPVLVALPITASGDGTAGRSPHTERAHLCEQALTAVRQTLARVNLCLDVNTPGAVSVSCRGTGVSITQDCLSYNGDYIFTLKTSFDVRDIDAAGIEPYPDDNRAITLRTRNGRTIRETWVKKYITPPYWMKTDEVDATDMVLLFDSSETAAGMSAALKQAVKQCDRPAK